MFVQCKRGGPRGTARDVRGRLRTVGNGGNGRGRQE